MLTPKPKALKKEKKNQSHELKCVTTTTKMKVVKVRVELKTFGTADLKHTRYATTSVPFE